MSDFYQSENLINALNTARESAIRGIVESESLTRQDREILQRTGHIQPIMRGWYHFSNEPISSETTITAKAFFHFLAVYLDKRLGEKWCFSAESSLEILLFPEVIPPRLVVTAMYSSTTVKTFPKLTRLTIYEDSEAYHPGYEQNQGLRLLPLEMAISRLPRKVWAQNHDLICAALKALTSTDDITWRLLQEGRQKAASRLSEALQRAGRIEEGNRLITRMIQAGYPIQTPLAKTDESPSQIAAPPEGISPPTIIKPTQNLESLWPQWQNSMQHLMMLPPKGQPPLLHHLARLQSIHEEDAVNSLELSGFQPTSDLILDIVAGPEKSASGQGWPILNGVDKVLSISHSNPLPGATDPMTFLACQGYVDAFKAVKRSIIRLLEKEKTGLVVHEDLQGWMQALVEPTTLGGFFPPECLTDFREGNPSQALTQKHCPPEAIPEELERLKKLLDTNETGVYLAAMSNLSIHWISPWRTGNGRLARFLMNVILAGGGSDWSIISGSLQEAYRGAIEDGIGSGNAGPLAILISNGTVRIPRRKK